MELFKSVFCVLFISTLLTGCSSTGEVDNKTAEGAYKLGEDYRADERYEDAIMQFNIVKNKFPYSRLKTEAELQIADINYERETYIEAQAAYEIFKELHPKHPKIDYVTFRLAMSFFLQLPDSIDRDLSLAQKSILYFKEVITSYSSSEYVDQAKTKLNEALKKLAEKELYIAQFYFIRDKFDSALGRYEDMLKTYPGLGLDDRALYGATISAANIKDKNKMEFYFSKLAKNHPDSKWTKKARQELRNELK